MLDNLSKLKQKLDSFRPYPPESIRNLEQWFDVELTYTSNAIEGNTLTRAETALVLKKGLTVGGKSMKEHLEAINHLHALQKMKELTHQKQISLTEILLLHACILKGIADDHVGVIRSVPVRISGSVVVFPAPKKVPDLLDEFIQWLETCTEHPVQKAALAHYKFVSIHPFVDGNGRTARLLMNLLLIQAGYPPSIIGPKEQGAYIKSLEKAQLGGSVLDYLELIYQSVDHSFSIYLKALGKEEAIEEKPKNPDKLLKIGAIAKETQEKISTIRYWTKVGLLDVATATAAGYQLYGQAMIERIQKIRALQAKRHTLEEILKMLAIS